MDYWNDSMGESLLNDYEVDDPDNSLDSEIAKMPRGMARFIAILFIGYMIMGLTGNFLTILALLRCPRVRNVTAAFIISLCVADFLFCVLVLPWEVSRFLAGRWIWGEGWICTLFPLLRYWNVAVSLLSIAMITINRYIMIAHFSVYKLVYRKAFIALMISFCWVFAFVMLLPTLLSKWGRFGFDRRLQTCSIIDEDNSAPKQVLFGIGFCVPALIIVICYSLIFMVIYKSEKRMRHHSTRGMNGAHTTTGTSLQGHSRSRAKVEKEARRKRNEWRITKMVLIIFIAFLVTYLPITLVKSLDKGVNYPALHVLGYVLIYISSCINPVIYVIMNRQYRQAYKTVLLCKRPRLPSLTSSHSGHKKRRECRKIQHIYCDSCMSKESLGCVEKSTPASTDSSNTQRRALSCPQAREIMYPRTKHEVSYQHRKPYQIRLVGFETPDTQSLDAISIDTNKAFGECRDCRSLRNDHKNTCDRCQARLSTNMSTLIGHRGKGSISYLDSVKRGSRSADGLDCSPQIFLDHLLHVESHSEGGGSPSSKDGQSSGYRKRCQTASNDMLITHQMRRGIDGPLSQRTEDDNQLNCQPLQRTARSLTPKMTSDSSNDFIIISTEDSHENGGGLSTTASTPEPLADIPNERFEGTADHTHRASRDIAAGTLNGKKKSFSLSTADSISVIQPERDRFHSLSHEDDLVFGCTLRHKSPSSRCLLEEVNLGIYERHASWAPWTPVTLPPHLLQDNPGFQE